MPNSMGNLILTIIIEDNTSKYYRKLKYKIIIVLSTNISISPKTVDPFILDFLIRVRYDPFVSNKLLLLEQGGNYCIF